MVHMYSRGRRKLVAAGTTVLSAFVACMILAAPAHAFPESGYLHTCDPRGSGTECWWNYSDAHTLDDIATQTENGRDQVCGKARKDYTTGPVDPDSACWANVSHMSAQFDSTHVEKKGYGYWAGNGGGIWVRVRAHY